MTAMNRIKDIKCDEYMTALLNQANARRQYKKKDNFNEELYFRQYLRGRLNGTELLIIWEPGRPDLRLVQQTCLVKTNFVVHHIAVTFLKS